MLESPILKSKRVDVHLPETPRGVWAGRIGLTHSMTLFVGTAMLALGCLAGWSLHAGNFPSGGPVQAAEAAFMHASPVPIQDSVERARRIRLFKLDVDSLEAQVSQAQDALTTAKSQYAAARTESAAAIAAATARDEMAQTTLSRVINLHKHQASTQDELDTAGMLARVARADLTAAQSKQMCVTTLEGMIVQRQSDVKVNQAKLHVAQAELEYAMSR